MEIDYEHINIDEEAGFAMYNALAQSDYAQVIFHNVAETYPTDAHVECRFTVTPLHNATAYDWIGLYKVGWSSSREYIYFHWVVLPSDYKPGSECRGNVLFQAHVLPKDDGDFYQFCYVANSGQIRGASTPFQFKSPCANDFVEVSDDECDMLVVTSKTIVLETEIQKLKDENAKLDQACVELDKERSNLMVKLAEASQQVASDHEKIDRLQEENKELKEKSDSLLSEANDMALLQESLREKIKTISTEKDEILKRLEMNEVYIKALQDKIKGLTSEKDALFGKLKMLEEEKELYKNHFTSSESVVGSYVKEIESLKCKLKKQDDSKQAQQHLLNRMETELNDERAKLDQLTSISACDKQQIDDLQEQLKNSEDKLVTVQQCKSMLNDEVIAVHAAHDKMAESLEKARSQEHIIKSQVARLEADYQTKTFTLKEEIDRLDKENQSLKLKVNLLEELNDGFEEKQTYVEKVKEEEKEKDGAIFAMKTAQLCLEKRLSKYRKQYEEIRLQLEDTIKTQRLKQQVESDLRREITDLKERLCMGADEYKAKFVECRKLHSELKKTKKIVSQVTSGTSTPVICESQQLQTKSSTACIDKQPTPRNQELRSFLDRALRESCTQVEKDDIIRDDDATEAEQQHIPVDLQAQLESLSVELESRTEKKVKYKQMLQHVKERNTVLQQQFLDEVRQYRKNLERSNKNMEDLKFDYNQRVHVLQDVIDRQKTEIDSLKNEVRFWRNEAKLTTSSNATHPTKFEVVRLDRKTFPGVARLVQSNRNTATDGDNVDKQRFESYINDRIKSLQQRRRNDDEYDEASAGSSSSPPVSETDGYCRANIVVKPTAPPSDDTDDSSDILSQPVTEYPLPLQPEVLPSAKLAAVFKAVHHVNDSYQTPTRLEDIRVRENVDHIVPETGEDCDDEEGFSDAAGEPQKLCPVCGVTFSSEYPQLQFEDHVQNHFGMSCPMCQRLFDSPDALNKHVEEHFKTQ